VNSRTTRHFWDAFGGLPDEVQQLAREKYSLWRNDPFHPSLQFKELTPNVWCVRIGRGHRAMARRNGDLIVWFWIGTHEAYNKLTR
jgi:hypothetical protein